VAEAIQPPTPYTYSYTQISAVSQTESPGGKQGDRKQRDRPCRSEQSQSSRSGEDACVGVGVRSRWQRRSLLLLLTLTLTPKSRQIRQTESPGGKQGDRKQRDRPCRSEQSQSSRSGEDACVRVGVRSRWQRRSLLLLLTPTLTPKSRPIRQTEKPGWKYRAKPILLPVQNHNRNRVSIPISIWIKEVINPLSAGSACEISRRRSRPSCT